jgi:hypothetical protein
VSEPVTTDDLLDDAEARTGLARRQLLAMVAKSAAVRHVATRAKGGELFVLKGGTLLTHVYQSPRQSIGDADYVHLDRDAQTDDVEEALRFKEGNFTMEPELHFESQHDAFEGKGVFSFDDIRISKRHDRELKITVSIRRGERIDTPSTPLEYTDRALTGRSRFPIEGLTVNELCAEKLLGWCSKDLAKHFVDLAYVARTLQSRVSHDRVAELVKEKFDTEGRSGRYRRLGINSPSQLVPRFSDGDRLKRLLRDDWGRLSSDEIFFLPAEQAEPAHRQLLDPVNVERLAIEFWEPALARL